MPASVAPRELLAAFFSARARSLQDLANRTINPTLISSPWLRGYFRELLVREFLQPLIPHTCRLVTGTVVDVNSWRKPPRERPQDDILLVDGECLPPLFEVTDNGMYPVESVLARFEVKTTIGGRNDVAGVLRAATEFWELKPEMVPGRRTKRAARRAPDPRPLQVLFAFNIKERARKLLEEGLNGLLKANPTARFFFCVPGKLLRAYTHPYPEGGTGWYRCALAAAGQEEFPEVLSFIALLLQELPALRELRRSRARLSRYVRCLKEHKLVRCRS